LSTVKCTPSKVATKIITTTEINIFLNKCKDALKLVGSEYFFNMDETFWRNINASITTIHLKNTNRAKVHINGNDKEGFTLVLIISAIGKILKPIIIAKGKTKRCLSKFQLIDDMLGTYSNNGWNNCGIMKIIIDHLYKRT